MSKKIILGLQKSFNLFEGIKKNMELYGYEVISICYSDDNFKYKNFQQRAINFFRKVFLNDKHYKNKLKIEKYKEDIMQIINGIDGNVDYTLLIRADIYPKEILEVLRQKSNSFIAYQWDGLHRFPAIFAYINMFDRFFIFDKDDLKYKKYNLLPLTNFYFDYDKNIPKPEECNDDVFFVGTFIRKRMPPILTFAKKAKELNLKLNVNILFADENFIKKYNEIDNINYINNFMTYSENIVNLKKAKIIVDFLNEVHNGLSLRTFEALYYNKKLITNNKLVKEYDFYHPNNIFIWDGTNLDGLEKFIKTPYTPIKEEIKLKYGFKNWLNYVLNTGNYTPITFP